MSTGTGDIPRAIFQQFIEMIDYMRDLSFNEQTAEHQKKMMGMTLRQLKALRIVSNMTIAQPQGIPLKLLASRLGMTVPATSLLVESMVVKGFFDRSTNPDDRRSIRIRLSEKGRANFEQICSSMDKRCDELFSLLTPEEREAFFDTLAKLYRHILPPQA